MNRLNQLFGANLVGTQVTNPTGGLPDGFPTGFMSLTKPVNGNLTSWDITSDTRDTGTVTTYGNPATRRNLATKAKGKAILLHTLDEIAMGQEILNDIVNSQNVDDVGEAEVARQTAQTVLSLQNTRVASITSMLSSGKIYVAPDSATADKGRVVDSSYSSAVIHADLGIPNSNLGNLPNDGSDIITAKWDQAGTLIATQIENMQRRRAINGTPVLKYCGYGPGVADALLNNTIVAKMIQGGNARLNYGTGIIEGLFDMTWYPLTGNFLKSSATAFASPFAKKVVFHPEPSRDWYELHEGSYVIGGGSTPAVGADAMEILRSLSKVRGAFSFARFETSPANIVHTFGDTFLPVLYKPQAIFIPTVLT